MKILMVLIIFPCSVFGMDHSLKGFVDSYHGFGLDSAGAMMSSRTRIRLETLVFGDEVQAFTSINGVHNEVVTQESGLDLREAYIQYTRERFDLRIGKQIIIWGKADGLKVTDLISPQDYSEFMARDFDDMRMPISAIKGRYLGDNLRLELIWIPKFTPAISPYRQDGVASEFSDNPWAITIPASFTVNDANDPQVKIENSEIAMKLSWSSSFMDIALMGFYGWDDLPAMHQNGSVIDLKYHRMSMMGLEFSIPFSSIVLRGESAYSMGRYRALSVGGVGKSDLLNNLVGVDYYPGSNWTVGFQLFYQHIVDYVESFKEKENIYYGSLNISKKLLRDDLNLSLIFFYGLTEHDSYSRFSADYTLTDGFHLIGGVDFFTGDSGNFGTYNNNDQFFIKAKYSF